VGEGVGQPLGPWDRDIQGWVRDGSGKCPSKRAALLSGVQSAVHCTRSQLAAVRGREGVAQLVSRFKIRNISIIKRTCENNNKAKHYPQRNIGEVSVLLEYFAMWLGDWCPKGQISIKFDIRTLKMRPQSFPESSDTKRPMTSCSFPEPRKINRAVVKTPYNLFIEIFNCTLFNDTVSNWRTIAHSNGIQTMFHKILGLSISAIMFRLQWNP